jgi:hypothetical protein
MRVRRAGGAYTPQRSKLSLSSKSRLEQPLERDSRAGGRRVNSLPAFARSQQNDLHVLGVGFGRRALFLGVFVRQCGFRAQKFGGKL